MKLLLRHFLMVLLALTLASITTAAEVERRIRSGAMSSRHLLPAVLLLLIISGRSASAEVTFEPTTWYSESIQAAVAKNQYWMIGEAFAVSPHDPPQLFVGFSAAKQPDAPLRHDVYTCWADGSHFRRLVADDAEYSRDAAWSPDGRRVAYVTCLWGGSGTRVTSAHLWVIDIESGQRWCVCPDYADGLRWQPDGQSLLFWRYRSPDGNPQAELQSLVPQACRVTAPWPTAHAQQLALSALDHGIFSPDGRSVAYWGHLPNEGRDGPDRVLIADIATGQVRPLEDRQTLGGWQRPGGMRSLLWSADGRKLFLHVYTVGMEWGSEGEFIVDVPTGAYHPVPTGLGQYLHPLPLDLPPGATKPRPRPQSTEVRWVDAAWVPGTHKLLCVFWDVFGMDALAIQNGETSPQYVAWLVFDTDTGQVEPVGGLPERKAVGGPWGGPGGGGIGAGRMQWSGRTFHFQNDFASLYRMK